MRFLYLVRCSRYKAVTGNKFSSMFPTLLHYCILRCSIPRKVNAYSSSKTGLAFLFNVKGKTKSNCWLID